MTAKPLQPVPDVQAPVTDVPQQPKSAAVPVRLEAVTDTTAQSVEVTETAKKPATPSVSKVAGQKKNKGAESSAHSEIASADLPENDNAWYALLPKLKLSGMALQLAEHCLIKQLSDDKLVLTLEAQSATLKTRLTEEAINEALTAHFGHPVILTFDIVDSIAETPAQRRVRNQSELQQQAEASISEDTFVQQLKQHFGGVVIPGSVRPK